MAILNVYLNFNGNCKEAFDFYKSVFGGEFPYVGTFAEMPPQEGQDPLPDEMNDRIMHISLPISKETTLMGSDVGGEWAKDFKMGNNFTLSITAQSKAEADEIFNKLSENGKVTMPMDKTFWGDYFGMCIDPFGVQWMMSFNETPAQKA